MPEGDTLHRLALDLTEAFAGRVVAVTSPQGRFAPSAALLDQTLVVAATPHGKHLFVQFDDDRWPHVHLGIGKFGLGPPDPPCGEVRVRLATPEVCGSRVRTEVLAGRNLFWCGRCQRRS